MSKKKVLIVDDSATVRQQVNLALRDAGFDVEEAQDGKEGLEKIMGSTDLSVIICDVNMPRMNGIEMVQALSDSNVQIPIVMLTTEGQPGLIREARSAGAKGWMVKPFNAALLLRAVQKLAA